MLRTAYPSLVDGFDVRVRSCLEVLAERGLPAAASSPALPAEVVSHDSCVYARAENVIEAPRQLLAAAARTVREPASSGKQTWCCGGPAEALFPARAAAVAASRVAQLRAGRAGLRDDVPHLPGQPAQGCTGRIAAGPGHLLLPRRHGRRPAAAGHASCLGRRRSRGIRARGRPSIRIAARQSATLARSAHRSAYTAGLMPTGTGYERTAPPGQVTSTVRSVILVWYFITATPSRRNPRAATLASIPRSAGESAVRKGRRSRQRRLSSAHWRPCCSGTNAPGETEGQEINGNP